MKLDPIETTPSISMGGPDITEREIQEVVQVLKGPSLSRGERLKSFEREFATFVGSAHAVGVSSGTSGLHLAVLADGIGANDLVLTTPFTFIASSNVLLYEDAVPIFVDIERETGNINPDLVAEAAEDLDRRFHSAGQHWLPPTLRGQLPKAQLKAILPVHVFGQPADMDPIMKVARTHSLSVIEDACEAVGSEYRERKAGTIGDFGIFGFYPNKQMTTAEGGIIVTLDAEADELMRSLRNQGREPNCDWLAHTRLGYNYRLNEMSAALGLIQLRRLEEMLAKRARVASWYSERLVDLDRLQTPRIAQTTTEMSWFVYIVRVDSSLSRNRVLEELRERRISCRPYFPPVHLSPFYVERFGYEPGSFPVTEELGRTCLALPFSGIMTESQVDYVCDQLRKTLD